VVVARVLRGEDNKLLIGTTLGTTTERETDWGGGGSTVSAENMNPISEVSRPKVSLVGIVSDSMVQPHEQGIIPNHDQCWLVPVCSPPPPLSPSEPHSALLPALCAYGAVLYPCISGLPGTLVASWVQWQDLREGEVRKFVSHLATPLPSWYSPHQGPARYPERSGHTTMPCSSCNPTHPPIKSPHSLLPCAY
jgi:hypothetical protein